MTRRIVLAGVVCLVLSAPLYAETVTGQYVEARTCDVWTGACFANAEMNLAGKHAVLAWKVDKGSFAGVPLTGLTIVAVIEATDTLGMPQSGPAKAVLLVDERASADQKEALIAIAKRLGGPLTQNVVRVESRAIEMETGLCPQGTCAFVDAGVARVETRCLNPVEDKVCGHEEGFYPPLSKAVKVRSAGVKENRYSGNVFGSRWHDSERRGAYVGVFSLN